MVSLDPDESMNAYGRTNPTMVPRGFIKVIKAIITGAFVKYYLTLDLLKV